jgi:hypothetical protein
VSKHIFEKAYKQEMGELVSPELAAKIPSFDPAGPVRVRLEESESLQAQLERTGERILHLQAKTKFASDSIKQHTSNVGGYLQKLHDEKKYFYELLLEIDNAMKRPQQETKV